MLVEKKFQRLHSLSIILVIVIVLVNGIIPEEYATASEESQRFYQEGIKAYEENRLEDALAAFQKAIAADPKDSKSQFQTGFLLYKMGEYEKAIPHLDRAGELDPSLEPTANYYAGLCYMWQEKNRLAEKRFQKVIDADPKSDLAESAWKFVNIIRGRVVEREIPERKLPIYLQASVSFQYDSNVIILPEETTIDLPPIDKEDVATIFWFQADVRPIRTANFYAGAAYYFYQSLYHDLDEYNMTGHFPTLYAAYIKPPYFAEIRYRLHYYYIDNEDYVRVHQVRPRISYFWNPRSYTDFFVTYEDKFFYAEPLREADNLSGGLMHYQFFRNNRLRLNIGYQYENEDAKGSDYDYRNHQLSLGAQYLLLEGLKAGIQGEFLIKDYRNEDSFADKKRRDRRQDYLAFLSYDIFEFLGVRLLYNGILNESNLGFREYERHIVSLSLIGRY